MAPEDLKEPHARTTRCGSTRTEPGPQDTTQKPCDQGSKVIIPGNHETLTDLLKRAPSWGGSAGQRADGAGAARCMCHMVSLGSPAWRVWATTAVDSPGAPPRCCPTPETAGARPRRCPPTHPVTTGAGPERCPPIHPETAGAGPGRCTPTHPVTTGAGPERCPPIHPETAGAGPGRCTPTHPETAGAGPGRCPPTHPKTVGAGPGRTALTYSQTKVPSGMSCRDRTPQPMFCVR